MKRALVRALREAGTSDLPSGTSILYCPLCGTLIHTTTLYRRLVSSSAWEAHIKESEHACVAHLEARHPLRYWLWKRTGWRWAVAGLR